MKRNFRKPLVLMTPKWLLRHKLAVSRLDEMAEGSAFQFVIREIDAIAEPETCVASCCAAARSTTTCWKRGARRKIEDVAIVRIEQLYPFPEQHARQAARAVCQCRRRVVPGRAAEQGAWYSSTGGSRRCCGRGRCQAPLCGPGAGGASGDGIGQLHGQQQSRLVARRCGAA